MPGLKPMISCYLQGSIVCSSSVSGVNSESITFIQSKILVAVGGGNIMSYGTKHSGL